MREKEAVCSAGECRERERGEAERGERGGPRKWKISSERHLPLQVQREREDLSSEESPKRERGTEERSRNEKFQAESIVQRKVES